MNFTCPSVTCSGLLIGPWEKKGSSKKIVGFYYIFFYCYISASSELLITLKCGKIGKNYGMSCLVDFTTSCGNEIKSLIIKRLWLYYGMFSYPWSYLLTNSLLVLHSVSDYLLKCCSLFSNYNGRKTAQLLNIFF